jgi:hypothetical protein
MPITYTCQICNAHATAQTLRADSGEKVLLPPYRWRAVDFPAQEDLAVLCPSCGDVYDVTEPKKPPRPFGVIDGGKTD